MDNITIKENKCKTAPYLIDKRINPKDAKFIFKMRTRMYPVKCNFKNQYGDLLLCDLCKLEEDSQEHLLKCKILEHFVPEMRERTLNYANLFGNLEEITEISKLLYKITQEREKLLTLNEEED